jgi:hypothetical protein
MFLDVVGDGKVEGNFQELVNLEELLKSGTMFLWSLIKNQMELLRNFQNQMLIQEWGLREQPLLCKGKSTVFDTDIFLIYFLI